MNTSKTVFTAIQDLRAGKITADEYRAIMRAGREAAGSEGDWERTKFAAIANDVRING